MSRWKRIGSGTCCSGYSVLPPAPQQAQLVTLGWSLQHCSYIPPSQPPESRMGRLLGRIVVGATLSLISFIAYSSQIFIIWPWYGRELSVDLITLLGPFKYGSFNVMLPALNSLTLCTVLLLACYFGITGSASSQIQEVFLIAGYVSPASSRTGFIV